MPLVKVKTKYQVTLPVALREQVGLRVGDLLEAKVDKGKITLAPKAVIDRGIAESIEGDCYCLHEIRAHPKS